MGTAVPTPRTQRLLALCGLLAPVLFALIVLAASLLRPGYSQTANFVSDLGVGPMAIVQNVNFVVFGLLVTALAFGLRESLPAPRGRAFTAGVVLLAVFALGVLLAGVFPEDFAGGGPHTAVSSSAFLAIIAAQLFVWRGLRGADPAAWGRYRTASLVCGVLSLAMLVVFKAALGGAYQGAGQRAFLAVPWTWVEITGLRLYSLADKLAPQPAL